ncbi:MAG TPA: hypothetical protein VFV34_08720, partial [Blastocatellia bacterium]|nr:hypothetical protein [Blastocatellia bacterium]
MRSIAENVRRIIALGFVAGLVITLGAWTVLAVSARSVSHVAATARRTFVYTIMNPGGPNAIAAYEANDETGELVFLGTYATGGLGTGRLVDSQSPLIANPEGTLLFAVNPGSDDISAMAIRADGSLALINSPISSRGVEPASLTLRNNLLYVANKGDAVNPPTYAGFRVEADGSLARIKRRIV